MKSRQQTSSARMSGRSVLPPGVPPPPPPPKEFFILLIIQPLQGGWNRDVKVDRINIYIDIVQKLCKWIFNLGLRNIISYRLVSLSFPFQSVSQALSAAGIKGKKIKGQLLDLLLKKFLNEFLFLGSVHTPVKSAGSLFCFIIPEANYQKLSHTYQTCSRISSGISIPNSDSKSATIAYLSSSSICSSAAQKAT